MTATVFPAFYFKLTFAKSAQMKVFYLTRKDQNGKKLRPKLSDIYNEIYPSLFILRNKTVY